MVVLTSVLLAGCAWEVPQDTDAPALLNEISGQIIVTGVDSPADTMVLLFAADDPPPPDGTGSPVGFATVPASSFTQTDRGMRSAPFSLTDVPDGFWLITALMDMDGDFQPLLTSNAGATCGDYLGAYLDDLETQEIGYVGASGGEKIGDVPVIVASEEPIERPAFQFASNQVDRASSETQTFTLQSTGVYSELVELTGPFDGTDACDTMFYVWVKDDDGDGVPDDNLTYPGQGAYDIWPRVYLQFMGSSETQLDEGEQYVGEAIVYPDFMAEPDFVLGVPTPRTHLTLIFVPAAQHYLPDGTVETVQGGDVPAGPWSVTVVNVTGQTWTLPNETAAYASTDASFQPVTQAGYLLVE